MLAKYPQTVFPRLTVYISFYYPQVTAALTEAAQAVPSPAGKKRTAGDSAPGPDKKAKLVRVFGSICLISARANFLLS